MATIYSLLWFDYQEDKQPGMVYAHLPLNMSLFSYPVCFFFSKRLDT